MVFINVNLIVINLKIVVIILKMSDRKMPMYKELCALLGKYLKNTVMDDLCNYICTCCCEDEKMSFILNQNL